MKTSRFWQLGILGPCILGLGLTLDVSLRFLPLKLFSFRGLEPMLRYPNPAAPDVGPFEPNQHYRSGRTWGDLAQMGNMPWFREFRPEEFTTDAFGFRNSPDATGNNSVMGIVLGDSCVFSGGNLTDEQTFPAQLAHKLGCQIYNAAGMPVPYTHPMRIVAIAQRLHMKGGVIIFEHLERHATPAVLTRPLEYPPSRGEFYERLRQMKKWFKGWQVASPEKILAERAYRLLQNDEILPNRFAEFVVVTRLKNGEPMLFHPDDLRSRWSRRPEEAVAYWQWLAAELKKENFSLLVVLVPNKYSIYHPLVAEPKPAPDDPHFLEDLENRTRAAGVEVVNLGPAFASQAMKDFATGSYLYWRDDTHWNAHGVELASEEVRPVVQQILQHQQSSASNASR